MRKLVTTIVFAASLVSIVSSCSSKPAGGTPNVTLVNRLPAQVELTVTSKKDKSEIKEKLAAGEQKKIYLADGGYDLVSIFTEQGKMLAASSESTSVEGTQTWTFEAGMGGPRRNVTR
ncbi:MAG: hypothetical protein ACXW3C_15040 [Pyrinomonadaceae bacterium]